MKKLFYIPEYSKLSNSTVEALEAICTHDHLELVIRVPVVYPVQWLVFDESPEKTAEPYIRQWQDKLQTIDLHGIEVDFELVYSYHSFVQFKLRQDDISLVYADRLSSWLHFFGKHKQKILSRNALHAVRDAHAVLI